MLLQHPGPPLAGKYYHWPAIKKGDIHGQPTVF